MQNLSGLRRDFAVTEPDLATFHAICRNAPGWPIAIRLYGIQPTFPSTDTDERFLRVWTREEIAACEQMEVDELDALLDTVRRLWKRHLKDREAAEYVAEPPPKSVPPPTATPAVDENVSELSSDERAIIEQFGFSFKIFDLPDRFPEQRDAEIRWFAQRLGPPCLRRHSTPTVLLRL